jgi:hypothetical protein
MPLDAVVLEAQQLDALLVPEQSVEQLEPDPQPADSADLTVPMAGWPVAAVLARLATVDGLGMRNLTAARQRAVEEECEGVELAWLCPRRFGGCCAAPACRRLCL